MTTFAPFPTGEVIEDNGRRYELCVCGWYSPIGAAVCNQEMHSYMNREREYGCTHATSGEFTFDVKVPFTRRRTRADGLLRCSACSQVVER